MMQEKQTEDKLQVTKDLPEAIRQSLEMMTAIKQEDSVVNADPAQEEWRDISWMDITGSFKILLSSNGRLKVQAKAVKDSSGRTAVKLSGEEILLDYLVASVFPEHLNKRVNSQEVSHKDGNLQNNAVQNLQWLTNTFYDGKSGWSGQRLYDKLRHFVFPENAHEKVPTDYMVRTLLNIIKEQYPDILEEWADDDFFGTSTIKSCEKIPDGQNPVKDGVVLNPRTLQAIERKVQAKIRQNNYELKNILRDVLEEFYTEKGDVTTPDFPNTASSNASKQVLFPYKSQQLPAANEDIEVKAFKNGTFRTLNIPDGYTVVCKTDKETGNKRFFVVNEKLYNQATRLFEYMDEYGSGEKALAKELTGDENADIKMRSTMRINHKLKDMPRIDKNGVITTPYSEFSEIDVSNQVVDRTTKHIVNQDNRLSYVEEVQQHYREKTQKKKDAAVNEKIESGMLDDIIQTLRKMSMDNMRQLRLKRGDRVDVNPDGHAPGKPIVMVDPINGRTQDFPSITKAIEFAGCTYNQMRECLCGRRRHINGMQYRFKYVGDAAHILSGIYLAYMRLIEERKEELESISDDDFEKLSEELDALEKTTLAEEAGEQ